MLRKQWPLLLAWALTGTAFKLIEDVTLGWTSSVAESLDITNPTMAALAAIAWDWGVPMSMSTAIIWCYLAYKDYVDSKRQGAMQNGEWRS